MVLWVISCYRGSSHRQEFSTPMVTCVIAPEVETTLRQRPPLIRKLFGFPVLLAVLFALVVFLAVPKKVADPDIGWHLRNAQIQLQTHGFLHQDLYSFTTNGKPWMDHEWLAEIPFYLGWRAFGPRGIFLVTLIAVEIVLLGILGLAYVESGSIKAAFVVGFAAMFLASVSFGPRTLLFGWMFLVLELGLLAEISPWAGLSVGDAICLFAVDQYPRVLDHWPGGSRSCCALRLRRGQVGFDRGEAMDPPAGTKARMDCAAVDSRPLRQPLWMAAGALSL